jgi:iron complex outermembrane receptor protein
MRTNSDQTHVDAFAALQWRGSLGRSLSLNVTGFDAERGVPPEEHIAAPRLWRYPFHSRALAALSASAGSFATPFGFGTLDVGAGFNSGRLRIDSYNDRSYSSVASSEFGDERTWTGRARFTHTLPVGAQLKAAATTAVVNYDETIPATEVAQYQQRLFSGGAEVELPLPSRTRLSGGIVYDRSTSPKSGGRTPAQDPFDDIGWRAGITHDVSSTTRLHASASQRSRFPALRELYSGALNRFMPNPELRPETLFGLEAGITIDRSIGAIPDATLQLNGFHHTLDDAVVRITLPAPDRRFQRINRDRIESHGAEMLAGIALGRDRERAVTITGDALIQRIRVFDESSADAMRHAENNPEVRGMLEAGVPLPARIRAYGNARYTGRQYCLNADTGNEMRLDARTQMDVALERRFPISGRGAIRSLRALLALDNVANAAIYDQCGLPQPGRTLRAMITIQ